MPHENAFLTHGSKVVFGTFCIIMLQIVPILAVESTRDRSIATVIHAPVPPIDQAVPLISRVGPPSDPTIQTFLDAGATSVREHRLSSEDQRAVASALAELPSLHRSILIKHLRRLSFVDAPASMGSALTSRVEVDDGDPQFDITLSAGLLRETLTRFLNRKEKNLFRADESRNKVYIDAGTSSVLTYVLLHETTHVVDLVLGSSSQGLHVLHEGVWKDGATSLETHYDIEPLQRILWRGGKVLPLAEAPAVYEALGMTPFVSLYAATAAGEDVAETVAWYELAARYDVDLRIEVRDKHDTLLIALEPLKSPLVRARFAEIKQLLKGRIR